MNALISRIIIGLSVIPFDQKLMAFSYETIFGNGFMGQTMAAFP
jgi:hypothetical protein